MLLKSINYWSYPGGLEGTLPLKAFFTQAKAHGYEAVEVAIGTEGELNCFDTTEAQCASYLQAAAEIGIKVASVASGIYWGFNLASPGREDRDKAVRALQHMARVTKWMGCKTLLTIPGAVDIFFNPAFEPQSYDVVLERVREGFARALPVAEEVGVTLAIENVWNKFLLSPTEMADFIDSFNSPSIGAYVDVANILPYGYPEHWLRILGKRVAGIHFKDFRRAVGTAEGFVDLLEGDVNWPAVMEAIREIGFKGPVVAELIPLYKHHPEARCAVTSIAMDYILGRVGKP
jgi:L-ribulose-5-phosphate 3-epimerase